jgi:hypothetical protein
MQNSYTVPYFLGIWDIPNVLNTISMKLSPWEDADRLATEEFPDILPCSLEPATGPYPEPD